MVILTHCQGKRVGFKSCRTIEQMYFLAWGLRLKYRSLLTQGDKVYVRWRQTTGTHVSEVYGSAEPTSP